MMVSVDCDRTTQSDSVRQPCSRDRLEALSYITAAPPEEFFLRESGSCLRGVHIWANTEDFPARYKSQDAAHIREGDAWMESSPAAITCRASIRDRLEALSYISPSRTRQDTAQT